MKNKTLKEIKNLEAKIRPLQERIYGLQTKEIIEVQRPRLIKMVGLCLRSSYNDKTSRQYARVLDLIECKDDGLNFLLETCSLNNSGNPQLSLDNCSPYLNKEWWDAPFPVSGWEICPETEYQDFKALVIGELNGQKSLRKWIAKNGY